MLDSDQVVMQRKEKFQCPNCGKKLPFMFVVKIKNDHEFDCPNCGETLVPKKTKPFLWGYILGFLALVAPAQALLYLHDDIVLALIAGSACGLTVIFLIALYVYSTTSLTKSN